MTHSKFVMYCPGQLKDLRKLGLTFDKETGSTEPLVWIKSSHGCLSLSMRDTLLTAMKLLHIQEGK